MHKSPEMVVPLHVGLSPSWLHIHTALAKAVSQRCLRIIDDYQGLWGRRNPTLGQEICLLYAKLLQGLFQLLPLVFWLTNPTQGSLQFGLRCNCMFTAKAHGRSGTWVNGIRTPDGTLYNGECIRAPTLQLWPQEPHVQTMDLMSSFPKALSPSRLAHVAASSKRRRCNDTQQFSRFCCYCGHRGTWAPATHALILLLPVYQCVFTFVRLRYCLAS
jgi:hypothetical protein